MLSGVIGPPPVVGVNLEFNWAISAAVNWKKAGILYFSAIAFNPAFTSV